MLLFNKKTNQLNGCQSQKGQLLGKQDAEQHQSIAAKKILGWDENGQLLSHPQAKYKMNITRKRACCPHTQFYKTPFFVKM